MPKTILVATWKRLVAFAFDVMIIEFLLLYPFTDIAEKAFSSMDASFVAFQGNVLPLILAIAAIYVLYFALFEYYLGQTIGKMLMKIVSVTIDNKRMSFIQAIGRNLFLIPVFPFIILWPLDIIFIIWKRISLSEILTKTKTVEGMAK